MMDSMSLASAIRSANSKALEVLLQGDPVLVDVLPAENLIPELRERKILHAGPPIEWDRMCGPMRGAIAGVVVFEGWAGDLRSEDHTSVLLAHSYLLCLASLGQNNSYHV